MYLQCFSILCNEFCIAMTPYHPFALNPAPWPHKASHGGSIELAHPYWKELLPSLKVPYLALLKWFKLEVVRREVLGVVVFNLWSHSLAAPNLARREKVGQERAARSPAHSRVKLIEGFGKSTHPLQVNSLLKISWFGLCFLADMQSIQCFRSTQINIVF